MSESKATVPDSFLNVIVLSSVGSTTSKVVSYALSEAPSKIILALGTNKLPLASNFDGPPGFPTSPTNT